MKTNIRRGVVAVATAFACVAALASPASAATLTAAITGGTVLITNSTGTSTDTLVLTPWTGTLGTDCSAPPWESSTTRLLLRLRGRSLRTLRGLASRLSGAGTWYILTVTLNSSTAGTVSNVTTTVADLNAATLSLNAVVSNTTFQSTTDTACTPTTTKCRFSSIVISLQGSYSGNIHTPTASNTASLTGTGILGTPVAGCTSPFTTYGSGTAAINGTAPLGILITAVT